MLPTSPDSVPFLLVRPRLSDRDVEDLLEDDEPSIPPRSVPPHAPPPAVSSAECDLPSVIVDLQALEAEAAAAEAATLELQAQRDSDVDGLLETADALPLPRAGDVTYPSLVATRASRWRSALVVALAVGVAGGACAGLAAHVVSARAIGAAMHLR